jgi:hypothetical protein
MPGNRKLGCSVVGNRTEKFTDSHDPPIQSRPGRSIPVSRFQNRALSSSLRSSTQLSELADEEEAAYALDPTRRADVAPRAMCATQR